MGILHALARFTQTEGGDVNVFRTSNLRSFACASVLKFAFTIAAIPWRFSQSNTGRRPIA